MPEGAQMAVERDPRGGPVPKTNENDARGTPPGGGMIPGGCGGMIGNPPFVPTDRQRADVITWTKAGMTANRVAKRLGISRSTLDRHFKQDLEIARFDVDAAIGAGLVRKALNGNLTAQIFYLRTRVKWNVRVEHEDVGGGETVRKFDTSGLDIDEKRILLSVIRQLLAQQQEETVDGGNLIAGPAASS